MHPEPVEGLVEGFIEGSIEGLVKVSKDWGVRGGGSGGRLLHPPDHPHHPRQIDLAHGRARGQAAIPEQRLGHAAADDFAAP